MSTDKNDSGFKLSLGEIPINHDHDHDHDHDYDYDYKKLEVVYIDPLAKYTRDTEESSAFATVLAIDSGATVLRFFQVLQKMFGNQFFSTWTQATPSIGIFLNLLGILGIGVFHMLDYEKKNANIDLQYYLLNTHFKALQNNADSIIANLSDEIKKINQALKQALENTESLNKKYQNIYLKIESKEEENKSENNSETKKIGELQLVFQKKLAPPALIVPNSAASPNKFLQFLGLVDLGVFMFTLFYWIIVLPYSYFKGVGVFGSFVIPGDQFALAALIPLVLTWKIFGRLIFNFLRNNYGATTYSTWFCWLTNIAPFGESNIAAPFNWIVQFLLNIILLSPPGLLLFTFLVGKTSKARTIPIVTFFLITLVMLITGAFLVPSLPFGLSAGFFILTFCWVPALITAFFKTRRLLAVIITPIIFTLFIAFLSPTLAFQWSAGIFFAVSLVIPLVLGILYYCLKLPKEEKVEEKVAEEKKYLSPKRYQDFKETGASLAREIAYNYTEEQKIYINTILKKYEIVFDRPLWGLNNNTIYLYKEDQREPENEEKKDDDYSHHLNTTKTKWYAEYNSESGQKLQVFLFEENNEHNTKTDQDLERLLTKTNITKYFDQENADDPKKTTIYSYIFQKIDLFAASLNQENKIINANNSNKDKQKIETEEGKIGFWLTLGYWFKSFLVRIVWFELQTWGVAAFSVYMGSVLFNLPNLFYFGMGLYGASWSIIVAEVFFAISLLVATWKTISWRIEKAKEAKENKGDKIQAIRANIQALTIEVKQLEAEIILLNEQYKIKDEIAALNQRPSPIDINNIINAHNNTPNLAKSPISKYFNNYHWSVLGGNLVSLIDSILPSRILFVVGTGVFTAFMFLFYNAINIKAFVAFLGISMTAFNLLVVGLFIILYAYLKKVIKRKDNNIADKREQKYGPQQKSILENYLATLKLKKQAILVDNQSNLNPSDDAVSTQSTQELQNSEIPLIADNQSLQYTQAFPEAQYLNTTYRVLMYQKLQVFAIYLSFIFFLILFGSLLIPSLFPVLLSFHNTMMLCGLLLLVNIFLNIQTAYSNIVLDGFKPNIGISVAEQKKFFLERVAFLVTLIGFVVFLTIHAYLPYLDLYTSTFVFVISFISIFLAISYNTNQEKNDFIAVQKLISESTLLNEINDLNNPSANKIKKKPIKGLVFWLLKLIGPTSTQASYTKVNDTDISESNDNNNDNNSQLNNPTSSLDGDDTNNIKKEGLTSKIVNYLQSIQDESNTVDDFTYFSYKELLHFVDLCIQRINPRNNSDTTICKWGDTSNAAEIQKKILVHDYITLLELRKNVVLRSLSWHDLKRIGEILNRFKTCAAIQKVVEGAPVVFSPEKEKIINTSATLFVVSIAIFSVVLLSLFHLSQMSQLIVVLCLIGAISTKIMAANPVLQLKSLINTIEQNFVIQALTAMLLLMLLGFCLYILTMPFVISFLAQAAISVLAVVLIPILVKFICDIFLSEEIKNKLLHYVSIFLSGRTLATVIIIAAILGGIPAVVVWLATTMTFPLGLYWLFLLVLSIPILIHFLGRPLAMLQKFEQKWIKQFQARLALTATISSFILCLTMPLIVLLTIMGVSSIPATLVSMAFFTAIPTLFFGLYSLLPKLVNAYYLSYNSNKEFIPQNLSTLQMQFKKWCNHTAYASTSIFVIILLLVLTPIKINAINTIIVGLVPLVLLAGFIVGKFLYNFYKVNTNKVYSSSLLIGNSKQNYINTSQKKNNSENPIPTNAASVENNKSSFYRLFGSCMRNTSFSDNSENSHSSSIIKDIKV